MITYLSFFFVAVNTLLTTIGALQSDMSDLFWIPLSIGLIWSVILFKRWQQLSDYLLLFSMSIAIAIVMNNGSFIWIVFGCFSAITSWELGRFGVYLSSVDKVNNKNRIIIRHLTQLSILIGSTLTLVLLVSQVTMKLNLVGVIGFIVLLMLTFNKKH